MADNGTLISPPASPSDRPSIPIEASLAEELVATATRAPSVHNTQPWSFRLVDGALEMWADTERQLSVADPRGRELTVSCGAALYTLRLAMRGRGLTPESQLLPNPGRPTVLARVTARPGAPVTGGERCMLAAVRRRHTHRGRFPGGPISRSLLVDLQRVAAGEGAWLHSVESAGRGRRLADLVAAADRREAGDPAWREELGRWTPEPGSDRRDGVPASAYPAAVLPSTTDPAVRDFGMGRGWGNPERPGVGDGLLTALGTERDDPVDWLRAGQALQAVLLRAAEHWAFAAIFTQPLELRYLRVLVRDELDVTGHVQLLLRFGYAKSSPTTPRRPVAEVWR